MLSEVDSALFLEQVVSAVGVEESEEARLVLMWQRILHGLEAVKERIVDEIGGYPHPIPACDVQFNGLLEERTAILGEYWQVKGFLKASHTVIEHVEYLNNFMRSSHYLSSEVISEIQELLKSVGAARQ